MHVCTCASKRMFAYATFPFHFFSSSYDTIPCPRCFIILYLSHVVDTLPLFPSHIRRCVVCSVLFYFVSFMFPVPHHPHDPLSHPPINPCTIITHHHHPSPLAPAFVTHRVDPLDPLALHSVSVRTHSFHPTPPHPSPHPTLPHTPHDNDYKIPQKNKIPSPFSDIQFSV